MKDHLEQLLKLVTETTNIHELIWKVEDADKTVFEGRFFDSLGYPVTLTNASGYMTPGIPTAIYAFFDGVEDVYGPYHASLPIWKWITPEEINILQWQMVMVRQICATISRARIKAKIPIKQALQSAYILGVKNEKPKFNPDISDYFKIRLNTTITPHLKNEGKCRNMLREIAQRRKDMGLAPKDLIDLTIPEIPKEYYNYMKLQAGARKIKDGDKITVIFTQDFFSLSFVLFFLSSLSSVF